MGLWGGSSTRVYRGGSFDFAASNAQSASRNLLTPEIRFYFLGLRSSRGITP